MINCGAPDSNSRLCEEVKAMALSVSMNRWWEGRSGGRRDFIVDAKSQALCRQNIV
ncbi:MAG: hypothetical protein IPM91_04485 [Bacteroidetes bacterium]|nr:hypothetical protein [Bacteroidota bacterium]